MPLNDDDLHRMRDAIQMGWDWRWCYDIDFEAAVKELLDDALAGGGRVAERVLAEFPQVTLRDVIADLRSLADDLPGDSIEKLKSVIDRLHSIQDQIDGAAVAAAEHIV